SRRTRIHAVHANRRVAELVRQNLAQALDRELRNGVRPPVRSPSIAYAARREDHRRVFRLPEQRQHAARQYEHGVHVHVHHALPRADVVMLDRTAIAEYARVMDEPVESAVARLDLLDQVLVLRTLSAFEVELDDRRFGPPRRDRVTNLS